MRAFLILILALLSAPAHAEGAVFTKQMTLSAAEAALRTPAPADPGPLIETLRWQVLQAGNRERAQVGLPPLSQDPALDAAAARYSRKMRDYGFFDHVSPDGETLDARVPAAEMWRYQALGENLWSGQGALDWRSDAIAAEAAANWVESPGHRENLFSDTYTVAGVGAAMVGDRIWITMLYATPPEDMELAILQRDFGQPPADLSGYEAELSGAIARVLNRERANAGLGPLGVDPVLGQVATENAGQGLWSGGVAPGVLNAAFAADPGRRGRLAAGFQRAGGGVLWQAETSAERIVARWLAGQTGGDLLDGGFSQIGVGVATDGEALMVTVILGETARPPLY